MSRGVMRKLNHNWFEKRRFGQVHVGEKADVVERLGKFRSQYFDLQLTELCHFVISIHSARKLMTSYCTLHGKMPGYDFPRWCSTKDDCLTGISAKILSLDRLHSGRGIHKRSPY